MLFGGGSVGAYSFAADACGCIPCTRAAHHKHFLLLLNQLQLILFTTPLLPKTRRLHHWYLRMRTRLRSLYLDHLFRRHSDNQTTWFKQLFVRCCFFEQLGELHDGRFRLDDDGAHRFRLRSKLFDGFLAFGFGGLGVSFEKKRHGVSWEDWGRRYHF